MLPYILKEDILLRLREKGESDRKSLEEYALVYAKILPWIIGLNESKKGKDKRSRKLGLTISQWEIKKEMSEKGGRKANNPGDIDEHEP